MKIVLLITGVVLLLIAGVVVIGARLPARHVVSRSAVFHAGQERLFALIVGNQQWRLNVKSCELISGPGGRELQQETSKRGDVVLYALEDLQPPHSVVRRIATKGLPYGGSWRFSLQPSAENGAGTTVRITEDGEVYNPVFRFVSRFVMGHTATIDAYLKSMASAVDEEIQITD